jgi:hypothetical protein
MARELKSVLLQNRIRFTTTAPVSVADVIASLEGMDRLVRYNVPKVVKRLTGANVQSAELLVVGLEDGSFIEDTLVRLFFKTPKDYQRFLEKVRGKYITKDAKGNTVIKAAAIVPILAALGLVGVGYYMGNKSPASGGLLTVNGNDNLVITIGAEAYKAEPEEFRSAVESAISRTRPTQAAKAGLQFFAPAQAEPGAGVELMSGNRSTQVVAPSTIRKLPAEIESVDNSQDSSYNNVEIKLRASDSDSESRGWAGTIDQVSGKRVRVVFINPADVNKALYRPTVRADVTVTYADRARTKPILITVDKLL